MKTMKKKDGSEIIRVKEQDILKFSLKGWVLCSKSEYKATLQVIEEVKNKKKKSKKTRKSKKEQ